MQAITPEKISSVFDPVRLPRSALVASECARGNAPAWLFQQPSNAPETTIDTSPIALQHLTASQRVDVVTLSMCGDLFKLRRTNQVCVRCVRRGRRRIVSHDVPSVVPCVCKQESDKKDNDDNAINVFTKFACIWIR